MMVVLVISLVLLIGVAVAVTLGRAGRSDLQLHPPTSTAGGHVPLGAPLRAADLPDVRFDTAWRGYRTDQVDALLLQLRERLAELEAETEASRSPSTQYGGGVAEGRSAFLADGELHPATPAAPASGASVHAFPRRTDDIDAGEKE